MATKTSRSHRQEDWVTFWATHTIHAVGLLDESWRTAIKMRHTWHNAIGRSIKHEFGELKNLAWREYRSSRRKSVPMLLCPPQIRASLERFLPEEKMEQQSCRPQIRLYAKLTRIPVGLRDVCLGVDFTFLQGNVGAPIDTEHSWVIARIAAASACLPFS